MSFVWVWRRVPAMAIMNERHKTQLNGHSVAHSRPEMITRKSSKRRTNCFAFYTKLPKSDSFHKMQLTLLNSGLVSIDGHNLDNALNNIIPQNRMELSKFRRYVQQIKRYDVLIKMEYQVWIRILINPV